MNFTTTILPLNITTVLPVAGPSTTIGFIACFISALCFATNYIPVKKYDTGDGMFFQWIMANAIFICSFVAAGFCHFPKFEPLVMLGGFFWATGNICVVPVVQRIGLGMGMLIWGASGLIFGWVCTRFGFFGIDPQLPKHLVLNYIGFSLTAICPFLYALVKSSVSQIVINESAQFDIMADQELPRVISIDQTFSMMEIIKRLCKTKSRIIGVSLSLFSGALYGSTFIPVMYVKNRYPNSSQRDIDYIFAQCAGIYLSSSTYFVAYSLIKGSRPVLYPKVILPAFLCGFIWFMGYVTFFFANESLSPAIVQPIVSSVCGIISTTINVVIFREVKGIRNYMIIVVAIVIAAAGSIIIGASKVG